MLYVEGNLRVEDNAFRQIARKKINVAIQSIEQKTEKLLDLWLKKLTPQVEQRFTVESLLKAVLTHPQMQMETATIERYSRDFPELENNVVRRRERIESGVRQRLEYALFPFENSRRFRFTKGFHIH